MQLGVDSVLGAVATDYTADANCVGAWFMNESLAGGDEDDQSSNNADLVETSGDIPTDAEVPAGYSGTSRLFARVGTEYLGHADGESTDINGINTMSIVVWVRFY